MKKTIILGMAIFFVITLGFIGSKFIGKCNANNNFTGTLTCALQEADLIFNLPEGIALREKLTDSLKEKLGKPLKVDSFKDPEGGGSFKTYYYNGYNLGTSINNNNDEVINIYTITGTGIKTNRGLMIGDDKDKAIKKYGSNYYADASTEGTSNYRFEFRTKPGDDAKYDYIIIITVASGKVKEISFIK